MVGVLCGMMLYSTHTHQAAAHTHCRKRYMIAHVLAADVLFLQCVGAAARCFSSSSSQQQKQLTEEAHKDSAAHHGRLLGDIWETRHGRQGILLLNVGDIWETRHGRQGILLLTVGDIWETFGKPGMGDKAFYCSPWETFGRHGMGDKAFYCSPWETFGSQSQNPNHHHQNLLLLP